MSKQVQFVLRREYNVQYREYVQNLYVINGEIAQLVSSYADNETGVSQAKNDVEHMTRPVDEQVFATIEV